MPTVNFLPNYLEEVHPTLQFGELISIISVYFSIWSIGISPDYLRV